MKLSKEKLKGICKLQIPFLLYFGFILFYVSRYGLTISTELRV